MLAIALKIAGPEEEATAASEELLAAADTTKTPTCRLGAVRVRVGLPRRRPGPAYEALRRGLTIAQDSGSRQTESSIAGMLSILANPR